MKRTDRRFHARDSEKRRRSVEPHPAGRRRKNRSGPGISDAEFATERRVRGAVPLGAGAFRQRDRSGAEPDFKQTLQQGPTTRGLVLPRRRRHAGDGHRAGQNHDMAGLAHVALALLVEDQEHPSNASRHSAVSFLPASAKASKRCDSILSVFGFWDPCLPSSCHCFARPFTP